MNWLQRRHAKEAAERSAREAHTDSVIREAQHVTSKADRVADRVARAVEAYRQMDERLCPK